MTRTHSGSLDAGGLNWDSLPLKLFAGGNAKFWNPADIDFSRDRADWESLTDDERDLATRLCAQFIAGEEAVTEDIQPFMAAMRAEGRLGDEMYLTQFAFEEAKHTQVFRMWLDAVGITEDLHRYLDDLPAYRQIFYEELPDCLDALSADPSPAAQIRASVTYNHIVEGMLALTGYYAWHRICVDRGILPGMQELVRRIGDDERRHMAWGTFTCRRHVAADDANWTVFETRMNELIPLALQQHRRQVFALYDEMPFGLSMEEFQCSTPPTRGCDGSARSAAPAAVRSERSTSTTRRCSSRTRSPTRTKRRSRLPRSHLPLFDLFELKARAPGAEQADVETQQHDQNRRAGEHRHRTERRERWDGDEWHDGGGRAGQRVADPARRAADRGREDLGLIDVEAVGEDVRHGGEQEASGDDHRDVGRRGKHYAAHGDSQRRGDDQVLALESFHQRDRNQRSDRIPGEAQRRVPQ